MVAKKKSKMMLYLFLIAIISMASNCKKDKTLKDDELSIQRTNYVGNQLRVNGYYYEKYSVSNGFRYNIYFFYTNGILLYGDTPLETEISQTESKYLSGQHYENAKKFKYYWGTFKIEGNFIQFERWYPSDPPLKAYVREGEILNDTTFVITESYRIVDGEKTEEKTRNETYQFKQFSPKPDSTNTFVP